MSDDRPGCHHTPITQPHSFKDYRSRPYPAAIADHDSATIHWKIGWAQSIFELVIAISDIHIRAEHVAVADFNIPTCINHNITVEIIPISNPNLGASKIGVLRPKPAALGKGVIVANYNLAASADATAALHPILRSLLHAESAIEQQTQSATRATRHTQKKRFNERSGQRCRLPLSQSHYPKNSPKNLLRRSRKRAIIRQARKPHRRTPSPDLDSGHCNIAEPLQAWAQQPHLRRKRKVICNLPGQYGKCTPEWDIS